MTGPVIPPVPTSFKVALLTQNTTVFGCSGTNRLSGVHFEGGEAGPGTDPQLLAVDPDFGQFVDPAAPEKHSLALTIVRQSKLLAIPGQALVVAQSLVGPGRGGRLQALPVPTAGLPAPPAKRLAYLFRVNLKGPLVGQSGKQAIATAGPLEPLLGCLSEKTLQVVCRVFTHQRWVVLLQLLADLDHAREREVARLILVHGA